MSITESNVCEKVHVEPIVVNEPPAYLYISAADEGYGSFGCFEEADSDGDVICDYWTDKQGHEKTDPESVYLEWPEILNIQVVVKEGVDVDYTVRVLRKIADHIEKNGHQEGMTLGNKMFEVARLFRHYECYESVF